MSTLPLSLIFCVKVGNISYLASFIYYSSLLKVVQEYERAVIFRLGRLRRGGAKVFKFHIRFLEIEKLYSLKGPGIFFIIPCVDSYQCVDLRTVSFDVPPQEVDGDGQTCNYTLNYI